MKIIIIIIIIEQLYIDTLVIYDQCRGALQHSRTTTDLDKYSRLGYSCLPENAVRAQQILNNRDENKPDVAASEE